MGATFHLCLRKRQNGLHGAAHLRLHLLAFSVQGGKSIGVLLALLSLMPNVTKAGKLIPLSSGSKQILCDALLGSAWVCLPSLPASGQGRSPAVGDPSFRLLSPRNP